MSLLEYTKTRKFRVDSLKRGHSIKNGGKGNIGKWKKEQRGKR